MHRTLRAVTVAILLALTLAAPAVAKASSVDAALANVAQNPTTVSVQVTQTAGDPAALFVLTHRCKAGNGGWDETNIARLRSGDVRTFTTYGYTTCYAQVREQTSKGSILGSLLKGPVLDEISTLP